MPPGRGIRPRPALPLYDRGGETHAPSDTRSFVTPASRSASIRSNHSAFDAGTIPTAIPTG